MQPREGTGGRTIGFRLEPALEERLRALAQSEGKSPGGYARDVITEHLAQDTELAKLRSRVTNLEHMISTFRAEFAVAVEALLVANDDVDESEAKAWVKKHLNGKWPS
jgi:predicted DNA-binding protein